MSTKSLMDKMKDIDDDMDDYVKKFKSLKQDNINSFSKKTKIIDDILDTFKKESINKVNDPQKLEILKNEIRKLKRLNFDKKNKDSIQGIIDSLSQINSKEISNLLQDLNASYQLYQLSNVPDNPSTSSSSTSTVPIDYDELNTQLENIDTQLSSIETSIDGLKSETTATLTDDKKIELKDKLKPLFDTFKDETKKLNKLKPIIKKGTPNTKLKELRDKLDKLINKHESIEKKINELYTIIDPKSLVELTTEFDDIKTKVDALDFENLKKKINDPKYINESDKDKDITDINLKKNDVDDYKSKLELIKLKLPSTTDSDELKKKIELEQKIIKLSDEIDKNIVVLQDLKTKIEEYNKLLEDFKNINKEFLDVKPKIDVLNNVINDVSFSSKSKSDKKISCDELQIHKKDLEEKKKN